MSTLYTHHANAFHAHPSPLCDLARFEEKLDLKAVAILDDAYEIARELEYSEVNVVFQALVGKYVPLEVKSDFVLSQIREHVAKLEHFSKSIVDLEGRCTILARHTE